MTAKGTPCCFVCGPGETCNYPVWNAYSKELTGMDFGVSEAYKGKIGAAVAVGVGRGIPSLDNAVEQIAAFMEMEG